MKNRYDQPPYNPEQTAGSLLRNIRYGSPEQRTRAKKDLRFFSRLRNADGDIGSSSRRVLEEFVRLFRVFGKK